MAKIGIFSGTFDPVHSGHIAFALESVRSVGLDKVYFLPEALPRRKNGVTHYAHRFKMLEIATRPYPSISVLELPDKQFSVSKSMPRLKKIFSEDELFLLVGSDVLKMLDSNESIAQWPDAEILLNNFTLVAGARTTHVHAEIMDIMSRVQSNGLVINTNYSDVSSSDIRGSIMRGKDHSGSLFSIKDYISRNWLYVSVEPNNS